MEILFLSDVPLILSYGCNTRQLSIRTLSSTALRPSRHNNPRWPPVVRMPPIPSHDIIGPGCQHGSIDLHPSHIIQLAPLNPRLALVSRVICLRIFLHRVPVICPRVRRSPRHVDQVDINHTVGVQVRGLWACQQRFEGCSVHVYTEAVAGGDVRRLASSCNPLLEPAVRKGCG